MVSNNEFKYDLGVVGLGYVGLPLAVESATSSLNVLGFDINSERVEMINNGHSPIEDISNEELSIIEIKEKHLPHTLINKSYLKSIA